jgi:hypothetical protein
MSAQEIAAKFAEQQDREHVKRKYELKQLELLDEGLKRLVMLTEQLSEAGIAIKVDKSLHTITIRAEVHAKGVVGWFFKCQNKA